MSQRLVSYKKKNLECKEKMLTVLTDFKKTVIKLY